MQGRWCTSRLPRPFPIPGSAPSPVKKKPPRADYSPLRRALGAADLQQVVVVLQLKVGENQGNGVSRLGQHGPGAVGVVVVLGRVVGSGDHPALAAQRPAAAVVRCRGEKVAN